MDSFEEKDEGGRMKDEKIIYNFRLSAVFVLFCDQEFFVSDNSNNVLKLKHSPIVVLRRIHSEVQQYMRQRR